MIELKARMLHACGFSRSEIEHVLGKKIPKDVNLSRELKERVMSDITDRIADQVISVNTKIIMEIKNAELTEYRRVMDALGKVDVKTMNAEDKLRHVKTLLSAQKYIYTTCQVNMEDRTKKKTSAINLQDYLPGGREG